MTYYSLRIYSAIVFWFSSFLTVFFFSVSWEFMVFSLSLHSRVTWDFALDLLLSQPLISLPIISFIMTMASMTIHPYTCDSQWCIFNLNFSSGAQIHPPNCLLDISTYMFQRHLKYAPNGVPAVCFHQNSFPCAPHLNKIAPSPTPFPLHTTITKVPLNPTS